MAFLPRFVCLAAFAGALACAALPAAAANCTADQRGAANAALSLSQPEQKAAIARGLPWGIPLGVGNPEAEMLLVQRDFVMDYNADLRDPLWVAYKLDPATLGKSPRFDCFRADPRLDAGDGAGLSDYDEPIFDQGHLANNADMTSSADAVINSFLLSNMTPQYCQFNEGVWAMLENIVRLWAKEHGALYVVTGSIFDHNHDHVRDPDGAAVRMRSANGKTRVAIPTSFYKILAREKAPGRLETITLVLPNDQTDIDRQEAVDYIAAHVTKIAAVQQITGHRFFPAFAGTIEEAPALWSFAGSPGHSLVGARCRATQGNLR